MLYRLVEEAENHLPEMFIATFKGENVGCVRIHFSDDGKSAEIGPLAVLSKWQVKKLLSIYITFYSYILFLGKHYLCILVWLYEQFSSSCLETYFLFGNKDIFLV